MDFSYTEEQAAIRELAQQIFADHADHERLVAIERSEERFDRELWKALADANLLGASVPESHGGSGMGLMEIALLLEEQGRAAVPVPLYPTLVLGALPLARFGTDAQQSAWLPGVAAGDVVLTAAFTEAAAADPLRPRTSAKRDGADWVLTGEKVCVPAGMAADRLLVSARIDDGSVGVFLVDPEAPGVKRERAEATNRELQAHVTLADVRVTDADVLGEPSRGAEIVDWTRDRALAALAAQQLGVSHEALRRTAEYTGDRKQFGKPIGAFQGVSLRAADAYIDLDAMRATMWQAVWLLDEDRDGSLEASVAKWWACRGGQRVAHTAQHLHGGTGADIDYPIHRFFLWSKAIDLTLGGGTPHLARIGALLASRDAA